MGKCGASYHPIPIKPFPFQFPWFPFPWEFPIWTHLYPKPSLDAPPAVAAAAVVVVTHLMRMTVSQELRRADSITGQEHACTALTELYDRTRQSQSARQRSGITAMDQRCPGLLADSDLTVLNPPPSPQTRLTAASKFAVCFEKANFIYFSSVNSLLQLSYNFNFIYWSTIRFDGWWL